MTGRLTSVERHPGHDRVFEKRLGDVNGVLAPALVDLGHVLAAGNLIDEGIDDTTSITHLLRSDPMLANGNRRPVSEENMESLFRATVVTLAALDREGYRLGEFGFRPDECLGAERLVAQALAAPDDTLQVPSTPTLVAALRATSADLETRLYDIRGILVRRCAGSGKHHEVGFQAVRRYVEIAEATAPPPGLSQIQRLRAMSNIVNAAASFLDTSAPPENLRQSRG
jgi:hypothetical protein